MLAIKLNKAHKLFILIGAVLLISALAIITFMRGETCGDCYEVDKGEFRYLIYNDLPKSIVSNIHEALKDKKAELLNEFNLSTMETVTVRIWGDQEAYLSEQERALGKRYPGSGGYVTLKNGSKPGELRLFGGDKNISNTALHEFVHLVTLELNPSFANNPRWLWESIAIYKSEQHWKYAKKPGLTRNRFEYMSQSLMMGDTGSIYEIGYTIGEFIENSWGNEAFSLLIKSNGDFISVTKKPIDQIFLEWKEFVIKKYY
ncbi:MAG: hypothetical protein U1F46_05580 [Marinagarivorans sp.]